MGLGGETNSTGEGPGDTSQEVRKVRGARGTLPCRLCTRLQAEGWVQVLARRSVHQ